MGKEGSRRKHDAEFKREAVRLVVERGLSVKKVAEDLGIHPNLLGNCRWLVEEEAVSEGLRGVFSWQGTCKV